jgi:two-component system response regulator
MEAVAIGETAGMDSHGQPMTIVLADDDPDDRALVGEALAEAGLAVDLRTVNDGAELLEYLRREGGYAGADAPAPDLVLLDLNMPRMSGHEVLEAMREDERLKAIPVIVLTTSSREDDVVRSYAAGGNSYITKPSSFNCLVDVMRALDKYWFKVAEIPAGR